MWNKRIRYLNLFRAVRIPFCKNLTINGLKNASKRNMFSQYFYKLSRKCLLKMSSSTAFYEIFHSSAKCEVKTSSAKRFLTVVVHLTGLSDFFINVEGKEERKQHTLFFFLLLVVLSDLWHIHSAEIPFKLAQKFFIRVSQTKMCFTKIIGYLN